jgi:DNA-binding NtrC family response regulator
MPDACKVVVVAEDETLIRMMAEAALTAEGYKVLEAITAEEAHAILESGADGIHALFTDVHMSGKMTGLDLAHHAHIHWPWVVLLVASGQARPHESAMPEGCRFIAKPYDPDHAVTHIREMLAAK